jgi:hypothetical protein
MQPMRQCRSMGNQQPDGAGADPRRDFALASAGSATSVRYLPIFSICFKRQVWTRRPAMEISEPEGEPRGLPGQLSRRAGNVADKSA